MRLRPIWALVMPVNFPDLGRMQFLGYVLMARIWVPFTTLGTVTRPSVTRGTISSRNKMWSLFWWAGIVYRFKSAYIWK
jgi:hypothetical protein